MFWIKISISGLIAIVFLKCKVEIIYSKQFVNAIGSAHSQFINERLIHLAIVVYLPPNR
jgi:hypothetical protein